MPGRRTNPPVHITSSLSGTGSTATRCLGGRLDGWNLDAPLLAVGLALIDLLARLGDGLQYLLV